MTIKEDVLALWDDDKGKFLLTAEVVTALPQHKQQSLYAILSAMTLNRKKPTLVRRRSSRISARLEWEYSTIAAHPELRMEVPVVPRPERRVAHSKVTSREIREGKQPDLKVVQVPPDASGKGTTKIFWTEEEKDLVAAETYRLRHEKGLLITNAYWTAQRLLPPERQRRFTSIVDATHIQWLMERLDKLRQQAQATVPPPMETVEQSQGPAPPPEPSPQRPQAPPLDVSSLPTEVLIGQLLRRGMAALKEILSDALSNPELIGALQTQQYSDTDFGTLVSPTNKNISLPAQESKERKDKVLLVGFVKGRHRQELINELTPYVDLRFASGTTPGQQMRNMGRNADRVIVLSDMVNHSAVGILKEDNIAYELMSGSIGRIKDTLSRHYRKEAE